MMDALKRTLIGMAILAFMTAVAIPAEYTLGSLEIRTPWTRETPKGATIGGGYVEIRNNGTVADRLLSGSVSIAKAFEIHQTTMDNGVAKMRQVTTGVEIGPGQTLKFEPGSAHLMFVNLTGPLHAGEKVHGTLQFEHAGTIEIDYAVLGIGAKSPGQAP
jgi:periplasmic copper chaperone A